MNRWLGTPVDLVAPTFGFQIHTLSRTISSKAGASAQLNIWDIGGQSSIRAFWRNYFEPTDGLVWVVDSTAPERLELCRNELAKVLQEDKLLSASLVVLANKQDVPGAVDVEQIKEILGWEAIAKRCRCAVLPCSALEGVNVEAGLDWLVSDIADRLSY